MRLKIIDAESEDALSALAAREIDCAITDGSAHHLQPRFATFVRTPLRSESIRLITRSGNSPETLAGLADSEWVLSGPASPIGHAIRQSCLAVGFSPNVITETDDHRIAFDVVLATDAVAVLPELALTDLPDGITVVECIALSYERSIEFTTRRSLSSNAAIVELSELLSNAAGTT